MRRQSTLFSALGVSDETFLGVVRDAAQADEKGRGDFVRDVNESRAAPEALSDQQMLDRETAAQIDDAIVAWIRDVVRTPSKKLDAMNADLERMGPQTTERRAQFDAELVETGSGRRDVKTYAELLDLQEGRLGTSAAARP